MSERNFCKLICSHATLRKLSLSLAGFLTFTQHFSVLLSNRGLNSGHVRVQTCLIRSHCKFKHFFKKFWNQTWFTSVHLLTPSPLHLAWADSSEKRICKMAKKMSFHLKISETLCQVKSIKKSKIWPWADRAC